MSKALEVWPGTEPAAFLPSSAPQMCPSKAHCPATPPECPNRLVLRFGLKEAEIRRDDDQLHWAGLGKTGVPNCLICSHLVTAIASGFSHWDQGFWPCLCHITHRASPITPTSHPYSPRLRLRTPNQNFISTFLIFFLPRPHTPTSPL